MRDQVAQDGFALARAAIGEIDLRQRQLGERSILLIGAVRYFLVDLFRLCQSALVRMDGADIILCDLALGGAAELSLNVEKGPQGRLLLEILRGKIQVLTG